MNTVLAAKCSNCGDNSACNLIDVQTFYMHISHDEYKRLDNITESEEEWKDCEIPR